MSDLTPNHADDRGEWRAGRAEDWSVGNDPGDQEPNPTDDFDDRAWWREHTADRPDPWGDGPVHHPTRFDLPMPAEPPF